MQKWDECSLIISISFAFCYINTNRIIHKILVTNWKHLKEHHYFMYCTMRNKRRELTKNVLTASNTVRKWVFALLLLEIHKLKLLPQISDLQLYNYGCVNKGVCLCVYLCEFAFVRLNYVIFCCWSCSFFYCGCCCFWTVQNSFPYTHLVTDFFFIQPRLFTFFANGGK